MIFSLFYHGEIQDFCNNKLGLYKYTALASWTNHLYAPISAGSLTALACRSVIVIKAL